MKELLAKKQLTKEELTTLDNYLSQDVDSASLDFSKEEIIKAVALIKGELGFSLFEENLKSFFITEGIFAKELIDTENADVYKKYYEIAAALNHDCTDITLALGDFYYNGNDKIKAKAFYSQIFRGGFDLCRYGYFNSLSRYIELYEGDKSSLLTELISSSKNEGYEIDFSNTYLLLISCLDKGDSRYIGYINKAIDITLPLVREYQSDRDNTDSFSDSDIERNLCELLSLKLEYYVENKDYVKAKELYNELTEEIQKSDCVRYYHARDRIYNKMKQSQ